ncbi:MAG: septum site-determining protein MinC [Deltaproteobacteria bacterium]|nr:septum site-determining protein MinC [Deltaproteobacteria bacterium]
MTGVPEASSAPFELKGGSFALMVLRLRDPNDPSFFALLEGKIQQAPNFFRSAPIVLDLEGVAPGCVFDLEAFAARLRALRLIPVAVLGGSEGLQRSASKANLAVMPEGSARRTREPSGARVLEAGPERLDGAGRSSNPRDSGGRDASRRDAVEAGDLEFAGRETPPARTTRVVTEPVRSGQRIYVPHGDLVVTAPVSPGAELLADGNIHVYSALRGRAMAGLTGDRSARIFCRSLEAELVSISGLYKVSEAFDVSLAKRNVHIYLDGDSLRMDAMV